MYRELKLWAYKFDVGSLSSKKWEGSSLGDRTVII